MSNINNKTQDLFALDTVQDLDNETAATCRGGVVFFGGNNPDVILYKNANRRGPFIGVNAAKGDVVNLPGELNDSVSFAEIVRGTWRFSEDANDQPVRPITWNSLQLKRGPHKFVGTPVNDTISSLRRLK